MCGILGIIQRSSLNKKKFLEFEFLLKLSESRGKEASGLCLVSGSKFNKINIVRSNLSPSEFINHKEYQFFKKNFEGNTI
jgi:glutamine phosphoribosylpyrophosphate amidotransferase